MIPVFGPSAISNVTLTLLFSWVSIRGVTPTENLPDLLYISLIFSTSDCILALLNDSPEAVSSSLVIVELLIFELPRKSTLLTKGVYSTTTIKLPFANFILIFLHLLAIYWVKLKIGLFYFKI